MFFSLTQECGDGNAVHQGSPRCRRCARTQKTGQTCIPPHLRGQYDAFKLADWEQIHNDITDSILKLK